MRVGSQLVVKIYKSRFVIVIALVDFPLELSDGKQIIIKNGKKGLRIKKRDAEINGIDRYWLKTSGGNNMCVCSSTAIILVRVKVMVMMMT